MIYSANSFVVDETLEEDELLCELCCDLIDSDHMNSKEITCNDMAIRNDQLQCGHSFCSKCWKSYLEDKVNFPRLLQAMQLFKNNIILPIVSKYDIHCQINLYHLDQRNRFKANFLSWLWMHYHRSEKGYWTLHSSKSRTATISHRNWWC